jgi:hypothetical protein
VSTLFQNPTSRNPATTRSTPPVSCINLIVIYIHQAQIVVMGPKRKFEHNKTSSSSSGGGGTGGRNNSGGRGSSKNSNDPHAAPSGNDNKQSSSSASLVGESSSGVIGNDSTAGGLFQSAGYLVTCDVPTKQFILSLEKDKDFGIKNFVLEDLDATHLLVKKQARSKIEAKVERWMDDVRTNIIPCIPVNGI